ncbi:MAG: YraN family protein [Pseudomonadota bacterium]|nr:YraN family protein [Pseudomonadota bacterium]
MTVGRSTSPTHQVGAQAEDVALAYLQQHGCELVARNFACRMGEIDLVMQVKAVVPPVLLFVEVRARRRSSFGDAIMSVTARKQQKLWKTAAYFLQCHPQFADYECRFDVIGVQLGQQPVQIEWIPAAFMGV